MSGATCAELETVDLWGVAWTRPRCEKSLCLHLAKHSIFCYLPLVTNRRSYGGRIRHSQIPLFPGYVFFSHSSFNASRVLNSGKAAKILLPSDSTEVSRDLRNIAVALKSDCTLREAKFGMKGTPVEVVSGPLKGVRGELVRALAAFRLIIKVSFLGKAAELEIDESFVRPLN